VNFSQNLLFPLLAVGLAWHNRRRLAAVPRGKSHAGLFLLATAFVIYAFALWRGKFGTQEYALMLALTGLALWFFGTARLRAAWAPLLLMWLTVPFPDAVVQRIIVPLTNWDRLLTSIMSVGLAKRLGVPAWREGFNLHLPEGVLRMDITCAGLNYVLSLGVIVIILLYLSGGTWKQRAGLVFCVPVVGVVSNTARVTANLLVAHRLGVSASYSFFHDFGGILFALVALAGMLAAARLLRLPARTAHDARAQHEIRGNTE
jgi:exosortase